MYDVEGMPLFDQFDPSFSTEPDTSRVVSTRVADEELQMTTPRTRQRTTENISERKKTIAHA